MPTYEYRCKECRQRFEKNLSYAEYDQDRAACPSCGSESVQRIIRPVRIAKSEESRIENMMDPDKLGTIDEDPQALGKLMRQMSHEMDEDMGPEFDEVVSRLEKGQDPEQIEKEMPELADLPDASLPAPDSSDE
jgi:putative FmdB family regulatory protein